MSTLERMSHHTSDETVHNRESFIILQPDESKTLVRVLSVDNLDSNDLRHDIKDIEEDPQCRIRFPKSERNDNVRDSRVLLNTRNERRAKQIITLAPYDSNNCCISAHDASFGRFPRNSFWTLTCDNCTLRQLPLKDARFIFLNKRNGETIKFFSIGVSWREGV